MPKQASAEQRLGDMLVFTWDGVGFGEDGTLWGGEALAWANPVDWQRAAAFRPFKLPGGERAGREPWRSAAALCWESGQECPLEEAADPLLFSFWQQGKNAAPTTAAGRLFDAASALADGCLHAGQLRGPGAHAAGSAGGPHMVSMWTEAHQLTLL